MSEALIHRRELLIAAGGTLSAAVLENLLAQSSLPEIRITGFDLLPVRATQRTVWLFVRLRTDNGISGIGEASDAFGFANTTSENAATMKARLETFFALIKGRSPFDVEVYRQKGFDIAKAGGLVAATAFSAIEQAMWDIAGKALSVPASTFFGGKVRDALPVYANVNRATNPRTPAGFAAAAERAVKEGFRAVKSAPFDGFPPATAPAAEIEAAIATGIASIVAMRDAVGPGIQIMVDCHSFFDVEQAVRVAAKLEAQKLTWYEEPVPPEDVDRTFAIRQRIQQPMAGGEVLFGISGFAELVRRHAVNVIMPDVKHCGGLLEMTRIAAVAATENIMVAPHNPSGPVSTAAAAQVAAGMVNFNFLELQYGEVPWRSEIVTPAEKFVNGTLRVSDRPGFGIELNEAAIQRRALPL